MAEPIVMRGFDEFICKDLEDVKKLIPLLCRYGMDPFKASAKLNQARGKTVCEIHRGDLVLYQVVSSQSIVVKGLETTPCTLTILKVKYADEYEGYTYRTEFVIRRR